VRLRGREEVEAACPERFDRGFGLGPLGLLEASRPIGTDHTTPRRPGFFPPRLEDPVAHWETMLDQLRAAADALNRGDPEPFVSLLAEDAEWRGVSSGFLFWKHTPS